MNRNNGARMPGRKTKSSNGVALETQRGRDELGRFTTLYKVDLSSGHFNAQFTRAFELSVANVRRLNKRPSTQKNLATAAE